jgi:predicted esterase
MIRPFSLMLLLLAGAGCSDDVARTNDLSDGGNGEDVGVVIDRGAVADRGGDTTDGGGAVPDTGGTPGCVSNGSGGPTQDLSSQTFTASNGLTSKYHLYGANLSWAQAVGLAVILHGDGGGFYQNPGWGADDMIKVLRAENMLTINVLTPDASTKTWWKNGDKNDEFLAELIEEEVLKRYKIDRDRVLIIGYSGGADFTTIYYLPGHGEKYCGGGALLFGGGTPPWKSVSFGPAFIKRFKLHFYTGQNDQYLSNAKKGSQKYTDLGFTVTTEWPAGIHHTNIPFGKVLQEQLTKGLMSH